MDGRSKYASSLAILVFSLTIQSCDAKTISQDKLRTALKARYADIKVAISNHDDAALETIFTPDFESIDVTGHVETAAQMIAEVNSLKPDPHKISITTIVSVMPEPNDVVVQQRYDMTTIKVAADGGSNKVELIALSTDTWIKPGKTWLCDKTVTDEISVLVNGQLAEHYTKS
jgi:hypothetical protein